MKRKFLVYPKDVECLEKKLKGKEKEIFRKVLYMFNSCLRFLGETEAKYEKLQRQNIAQEVRIEYLIRSNDRREESIMELQQQINENQNYKKKFDKVKQVIINWDSLIAQNQVQQIIEVFYLLIEEDK